MEAGLSAEWGTGDLSSGLGGGAWVGPGGCADGQIDHEPRGNLRSGKVEMIGFRGYPGEDRREGEHPRARGQVKWGHLAAAKLAVAGQPLAQQSMVGPECVKPPRGWSGSRSGHGAASELQRRGDAYRAACCRACSQAASTCCLNCSSSVPMPVM
jgi:hypothetical protein